MTVQVWYEDHGVRYNRPRIVTLKEEEDHLFEILNRLVPAEAWGVLSDSTGLVWYARRVAANPTGHNTWAAFDQYEAEESVDRREVGLRDGDSADGPTLYLQDIRHIEKMPIDVDVGGPGQQLRAMSQCLLRL